MSMPFWIWWTLLCGIGTTWWVKATYQPGGDYSFDLSPLIIIPCGAIVYLPGWVVYLWALLP